MTTDIKPYRNVPGSNKLGKPEDASDLAFTSAMKARSDVLRGKPSLPMICLLLVGIILGTSGSFPASTSL